MISGLITAVLLAAFVGITAWAWSSRQRQRFHEAAQLPFTDEAGGRPVAGLSSPGCPATSRPSLDRKPHHRKPRP